MSIHSLPNRNRRRFHTMKQRQLLPKIKQKEVLIVCVFTEQPEGKSITHQLGRWIQSSSLPEQIQIFLAPFKKHCPLGCLTVAQVIEYVPLLQNLWKCKIFWTGQREVKDGSVIHCRDARENSIQHLLRRLFYLVTMNWKTQTLGAVALSSWVLLNSITVPSSFVVRTLLQAGKWIKLDSPASGGTFQHIEQERKVGRGWNSNLSVCKENLDLAVF